MPWITLADIGAGGDRRLRRGAWCRSPTPVCCRGPTPKRRASYGRPEPGDDRPGRGQPGRGLLPGLPDQQQFVAHAGGRGRRRQDAAHRRRRRGCGRAAAVARARTCCAYLPTTALAAVVIAAAHRPVRVRRPAPHLAHPALGVLAVDRLLRIGVVVLGAIPGIGLAVVAGGDRVPLGRLAPPLGRARPREAASAATTTFRATRMPGWCRAWSYSAGTPRCSSPMPSGSTNAPCCRPSRARRRRCGCIVVITAEPVTSVDVTSADIRRRARRHACSESGIELCISPR
jgi:hypothetical protein